MEIICILLYTVHLAAVTHAYGLAHFKVKRWSTLFLVETALALFDWFLFYCCGLHRMFRFSRPLRPLLLVALSPSLRRCVSSATAARLWGRLS